MGGQEVEESDEQKVREMVFRVGDDGNYCVEDADV